VRQGDNERRAVSKQLIEKKNIYLTSIVVTASLEGNRNFPLSILFVHFFRFFIFFCFSFF